MIKKSLKLKYEIITWTSEEGIEEDARISDDDWKELEEFGSVLEVFADTTTFLQGQDYPTIQNAIQTFNILFDKLDEISEKYPNNMAVKQAFKKLKKYYKLSDDCSANFIAAVLNPNEKMCYFNDNGFEDEEKLNIKSL